MSEEFFLKQKGLTATLFIQPARIEGRDLSSFLNIYICFHKTSLRENGYFFFNTNYLQALAVDP